MDLNLISKEDLTEVLKNGVFTFGDAKLQNITEKLNIKIRENIKNSEHRISIQTLDMKLQYMFNIKGIYIGWRSDNKKKIEKLYYGLQGTEDLPCKILTLSGTIELGATDKEYYDIQFEDGTILDAVSGFHLTPIKTKTWEDVKDYKDIKVGDIAYQSPDSGGDWDDKIGEILFIGNYDELTKSKYKPLTEEWKDTVLEEEHLNSYEFVIVEDGRTIDGGTTLYSYNGDPCGCIVFKD